MEHDVGYWIGYGIGASVMLSFMLSLYMVPTIIALFRGHSRRGWIALLNFTSGWTGIGWIVALVWAVSTERVDQVPPVQMVSIPQPAHRFCSRCGQPDQGGSRFCPHCGAALS